jgi:hypothetical protein
MSLTRWLPRGFVGRVLVATCFLNLGAQAQTNFSIYSDELDNAYQDWSWGTHNLANTTPVHSGTSSVAFSGTTWQAISFWHQDFDPTPYTNLTFWANGGAGGGQVLQVFVQYGTNTGPAYQLPALAANTWQQFSLPFATLGIAGAKNVNRLNWQLTSSGTANGFYLDDINLTAIAPAQLHLSVNASQTVRAADARWFGLNTAVWDNNFDTPTTANALQQLGTGILRFPGGSLADQYHWATGTTLTNTWTWGTSFNNFIHVATNAGAQAMITVNYGTGTPQEAAAWVRSANVTNRLGFKDWEIGNEVYGTWETDSNNLPNDPYTYATRAAQYITQMRAADPTIKIGVVSAPGENTYSNNATHFAVNPRTGTTNYGWTPIMLSTLKALGVTPDFLIHHVYPEYGVDSDQSLLLDSANWAGDAADLRQQITDYIGSAGTNIELICTENNSDSGNQGKQSTSLVNGLYLADSLAHLMQTEFDGFIWWDLRNGSDTSGDFSASLYGWRTVGDLGIIGGLNTYYPTFYADKLMHDYVQGGDTILTATSDYGLVTDYASRKADGALTLLVINKDRDSSYTAQITLTNFSPSAVATVHTFGMPQDDAAETNGPAADQDVAVTNFPTAAAHFTATFSPYSLTLFTFAPESPNLRPVSIAGGKYVLQLTGQSGAAYVVQSTTNLPGGIWTSESTNFLVGSSMTVTSTVPSGTKFWRTVWLP